MNLIKSNQSTILKMRYLESFAAKQSNFLASKRHSFFCHEQGEGCKKQEEDEIFLLLS